MRYRVEFRYRPETGEVEMLQVDVVEGAAGRAPDHDAEHDRVTAEIASVLESDAEFDEVGPEREPLPPEPLPVPRPVDPGERSVEPRPQAN